MRSPYSIFPHWADNSTALVQLLVERNISRAQGLTIDWTDDEYPTVPFLNQVLKELYTLLIDWQKSGILEYDRTVSQGYDTHALVIDSNGILKQALVDGAEVLDPANDPTESCWRTVIKPYTVGSESAHGLIQLEGGGTATPARSEQAIFVTAPLILSPAALSLSALDTVVFPDDGVVSGMALSDFDLILTRSNGLDTLTEDLSDLITRFARLDSPTFLGTLNVPYPSFSADNTLVPQNLWVTTVFLFTIVTATRSRFGTIRFANNNELRTRPTSANARAVSPAGLAYRLTLPFGTQGQPGNNGVTPPGPQGDPGEPGRDANPTYWEFA